MRTCFFLTDYFIYSRSLEKNENRLVYKTFSFKASFVDGIKYPFFGTDFFRYHPFILVLSFFGSLCVVPVPLQSDSMCTMPEILFRFLFIKAFWLRALVLTNVMRQIDEMFHYFVTMVTHRDGGEAA